MDNNSNKVAVVAAYFGHFPAYFPLWVKSCAYNPTVDFYVFTDQLLSDIGMPKNVKLIGCSLSEMKERASKVLGFDAVLSRPYKCCDYKPLYGLMFSDYLSSYDYWGHCDMDLIFGDLQHFFDLYNLYGYDKFGTLGHLSLFRNIEKVNNAYKIPNRHKDYREVYSNESNMVFDELGGISAIMAENGFKVFQKRFFADIATTYHRYRVIDVYPLDEKPANYPDQSFYWQNGKTFRIYRRDGKFSTEEYAYVHFQKRHNFPISLEVLTSDGFFITNTGFVPYNGSVVNEVDFNSLNPYKGRFYEAMENRCNLFLRRLIRYANRLLHK